MDSFTPDYLYDVFPPLEGFMQPDSELFHAKHAGLMPYSGREAKLASHELDEYFSWLYRNTGRSERNVARRANTIYKTLQEINDYLSAGQKGLKTLEFYFNLEKRRARPASEIRADGTAVSVITEHLLAVESAALGDYYEDDTDKKQRLAEITEYVTAQADFGILELCEAAIQGLMVRDEFWRYQLASVQDSPAVHELNDLIHRSYEETAEDYEELEAA